jgi:hypothetical protein
MDWGHKASLLSAWDSPIQEVCQRTKNTKYYKYQLFTVYCAASTGYEFMPFEKARA